MTFERIDGLEVRGNINPLPALRKMLGVRALASCRLSSTETAFPARSRTQTWLLINAKWENVMNFAPVGGT